MKKRFPFIFGGAFALALAACAIFAGPDVMRAGDAPTIEHGVAIGPVDVGGLTREAAQERLESYISSAEAASITLKAGGESVVVRASDLGVSFDDANLVSEALSVGNSGSLIQRYKDKKDLERGSKVIALKPEVDRNKAAALLADKAGELDRKAVDSSLVREDGKFRIIEGEEGIEVNVAESADAIESYMGGEWDGSDAQIELSADIVEPRGSEEELSQVTDLMGSFSTSYGDSTENRCTNISVAAGKINGTLLYPGEEFSVYETIGPLDAENGYELAGAYENGQTVESYGGGVCQVSSTLYNAVILAELEVTERSNHSMIVTYVKPSMDAAIAGDYKDLKFVNNQELPIYIEGYTSGRTLYFNIFGHETRPANRTVSYESEIVSRQDPGTQFVGTGDPIGTMATAQSSHVGYVAQLWKVVTVDGEEESREVFNKSTYKAVPRIVHVGTASADPNASAIVGQALATGDEGTIRNAINQALTGVAPVPADGSVPVDGSVPADQSQQPPADQSQQAAPADQSQQPPADQQQAAPADQSQQAAPAEQAPAGQ